MEFLIGMMTTAGAVTLQISEDDPVLDLKVCIKFFLFFLITSASFLDQYLKFYAT